MITVGALYVLASIIVSGLLINLGRRANQASAMASRWTPQDFPNDPLWPDDPLCKEAIIDLTAMQPVTDVRAAMRLALKRVGPLLISQSVRAEIDAPSGLLVRMPGAELTDTMQRLLTSAIQGAPAANLLVTAAQHDDGIYVRITDDIPGANIGVRTDNIRGLIQGVAIGGGALDVAVRPNEGTTLTLRLPSVPKDRRALAREEVADPFDDNPMQTRLSFGKSH